MRILTFFRHCEQREAIPLGSPRRFAPRDDDLLRGFSLIELLIVFSLIGLLTIASLVAFRSYQSTQTFQTSSSGVVQMVNLAKSRSLTQVKPEQCISSGEILRGYQIRVVPSGSDYQLEAICNTSTYVIEAKKLPSQVTFTASSQMRTLFSVSTAIVTTPGTIVITGFGKTKTITVSRTGTISVL